MAEEVLLTSPGKISSVSQCFPLDCMNVFDCILFIYLPGCTFFAHFLVAMTHGDDNMREVMPGHRRMEVL